MLTTHSYNLLDHLFTATLGGQEAQFKMAPAYRERYNLAYINNQNPKKASILILLFPQNEALHLILIKRADYQGHHAGQISFPGGKVEPVDNSLFETALRETKEEIGISLENNILRRPLTQVYIPPSGFLVQPYLAFYPKVPVLQPNYEVEKILTPDLHSIITQKVVYKTIIASSGKKWESPGIDIENNFVWGATAMMLSELIDLTKRF
jgi:8-oxo-dGTP pyrophosphatase MutT (NUDIX family)